MSSHASHGCESSFLIFEKLLSRLSQPVMCISKMRFYFGFFETNLEKTVGRVVVLMEGMGWAGRSFIQMWETEDFVLLRISWCNWVSLCSTFGKVNFSSGFGKVTLRCWRQNQLGRVEGTFWEGCSTICFGESQHWTVLEILLCNWVSLWCSFGTCALFKMLVDQLGKAADTVSWEGVQTCCSVATACESIKSSFDEKRTCCAQTSESNSGGEMWEGCEIVVLVRN